MADSPSESSESSSVSLQLALDKDGRVALHNETSATDAGINCSFRSWSNFFNVQTLMADCKTLSAAATRKGDTYSGGDTYWFPATCATPNCALESLASSIFQWHMSNVNTDLYDINCSGSEWWTLYLDSDDDVGFHWDKDYTVETDCGVNVFPMLSTVSYVSSNGGATIVCEKTQGVEQGEGIEGSIAYGFVSRPKQGKHISFDGRYLHGASSDIKDPRNNGPRISFLVNLWLNHKPVSSERLNSKIASSLSQHRVNAPTNEVKEDAVVDVTLGDSFELTRWSFRQQYKFEVLAPLPVLDVEKTSMKILWNGLASVNILHGDSVSDSDDDDDYESDDDACISKRQRR